MRARDWLLGVLFVLLLSVDGWGQPYAPMFEETDAGLVPAIGLLVMLWSAAFAAGGGKQCRK